MFPEWVSFSSNTVYICPKQTPVCRYTDSLMYLIYSFIKSSHVKYGVCSHENTFKCLLTVCFNNLYLYRYGACILFVNFR